MPHQERRRSSARELLASSQLRAVVDAAWQKTKLISKMEDRCSIEITHQWIRRIMSITKTGLRHPNERPSNVQSPWSGTSPAAPSLWCMNVVLISKINSSTTIIQTTKVRPDCQKSCHRENWVQLKTIESKSRRSSQSQLYEDGVRQRVEAPITVRFA